MVAKAARVVADLCRVMSPADYFSINYVIITQVVKRSPARLCPEKFNFFKRRAQGFWR